MRSLKYFLATTAVVLLVSLLSMAQWKRELDSTKADPQHHQVVFENDQVRVVHYLIAPGDKTAKHSHPESVNILLTDSHARVTGEDGKSADSQGKAGATAWRPAVTHVFENVGDKPIEGVLVEPKKPHSARPQVPPTKPRFRAMCPRWNLRTTRCGSSAIA